MKRRLSIDGIYSLTGGDREKTIAALKANGYYVDNDWRGKVPEIRKSMWLHDNTYRQGRVELLTAAEKRVQTAKLRYEACLLYTSIYIDYEDSARNVVKRLLLLGVAGEQIVAHFHYVRPSAKPSSPTSLDGWRETLDYADTATLAIIDGVMPGRYRQCLGSETCPGRPRPGEQTRAGYRQRAVGRGPAGW